MKPKAILLLAALAALVPQICPGNPSHKNIFVRGAVHGRVINAAGAPLQGATVALLSRTGKVMAWTKTDDKGQYTLAVDPKVALDIQPSRNRGLLMMCCRAAGEAVMVPVRAVANMVANPGLTVAAAGVSIASGTPAPIEAQAISAQVPNHENVVQTQHAAQGAVAAQVFGVGPKLAPPDVCTEGEASLLVEAAGYKMASLNPSAYWMEPPGDIDGKPVGLQTWVDSVKLAATDVKDKDEVVPESFTLSDATVFPALAAAGQDIHISVKVNGPLDADHPIRVFARECPRNQVIELKPGKDDSVYEGTMTLDRSCSLGSATVCIGALRAEPVEVKLDVTNSAALFRFVKRLEDMEAGKPYGYDPMIMAGKNRADVPITVLSPNNETPPSDGR